MRGLAGDAAVTGVGGKPAPAAGPRRPRGGVGGPSSRIAIIPERSKELRS